MGMPWTNKDSCSDRGSGPKRKRCGFLHDVAHEEMPDRELAKVTVKVRSDSGAQLFEASLILTSGWSA